MMRLFESRTAMTERQDSAVKVWAMLFVGMLAAGGWGASFYVSKSGNNTTGANPGEKIVQKITVIQ